MTNPLILIAFGIFVGVFSGLMGLGGGAVMIPMLVLLVGLDQARAHGVSLMVMCVPVMLPAVLGYFQRGMVSRADILIAAMLAIGFAGGSYFGSQIAFALTKYKGGLSLTFGLLLIYVAAYTALGKENILRSLLLAMLITIMAATVVIGVRIYDRSNASPDGVASVANGVAEQQ